MNSSLQLVHPLVHHSYTNLQHASPLLPILVYIELLARCRNFLYTWSQFHLAKGHNCVCNYDSSDRWATTQKWYKRKVTMHFLWTILIVLVKFLVLGVVFAQISIKCQPLKLIFFFSGYIYIFDDWPFRFSCQRILFGAKL